MRRWRDGAAKLRRRGEPPVHPLKEGHKRLEVEERAQNEASARRGGERSAGLVEAEEVDEEERAARIIFQHAMSLAC